MSNNLEEIILTKEDKIEAYKYIFKDDEEHINSFFEGYKPNYYFKNVYEDLTESQLKEIFTKSILEGKDKFASCNSLSKSITLDELEKLADKLNKLPPTPIEIEIGKIAWDILANQLNIHMIHDKSKISTLFGIRIAFYEGNEIKFNQMRVKYNNGDSKVIDVFEHNCNYDFIYKNIFEEE